MTLHRRAVPSMPPAELGGRHVSGLGPPAIDKFSEARHRASPRPPTHEARRVIARRWPASAPAGTAQWAVSRGYVTAAAVGTELWRHIREIERVMAAIREEPVLGGGHFLWEGSATERPPAAFRAARSRLEDYPCPPVRLGPGSEEL